MNVADREIEVSCRREPGDERAPDLARPDYAYALQSLKLIEECAFGKPFALFGRNLDVARRQEEDPVRDSLYLTIQSVSQTCAEVHHPAAELPIGLLKVQDHG